MPGGSANAYDYAMQDPINQFDLDGRCVWHCHWHVVRMPKWTTPFAWAGRHVEGAASHFGFSANVCGGFFIGGCVGFGVNGKDGASWSSGWTGLHKGRMIYGLSGGPALTYQRRAVGNGYCASAPIVGACKDRRGNRQWSFGAPSRWFTVGVVSNRSRRFPWDD